MSDHDFGSCSLALLLIASVFLLSEEIKEIIEIMFEYESYSLCGESRFHIKVSVVEMIVCFQAPVALPVQQVFNIEVSDKLIIV